MAEPVRVATYNIHKGVMRELFGLRRISQVHGLRHRKAGGVLAHAQDEVQPVARTGAHRAGDGGVLLPKLAEAGVHCVCAAWAALGSLSVRLFSKAFVAASSSS